MPTLVAMIGAFEALTVAVIGVPEALMLLAGSALFGVLTALGARRRGRRTELWAVLGCLFGPIALVAVAILPASHEDLDEG